MTSQEVKPYVDVAIVVPLQEEFERLQHHFSPVSEFVEGGMFGCHIQLDDSNLSGVVYLQDDMGKAAATRAAQAAITKYDIGILIVIGIAGGAWRRCSSWRCVLHRVCD